MEIRLSKWPRISTRFFASSLLNSLCFSLLGHLPATVFPGESLRTRRSGGLEVQFPGSDEFPRWRAQQDRGRPAVQRPVPADLRRQIGVLRWVALRFGAGDLSANEVWDRSGRQSLSAHHALSAVPRSTRAVPERCLSTWSLSPDPQHLILST